MRQNAVYRTPRTKVCRRCGEIYLRKTKYSEICPRCRKGPGGRGL